MRTAPKAVAEMTVNHILKPDLLKREDAPPVWLAPVLVGWLPPEVLVGPVDPPEGEVGVCG